MQFEQRGSGGDLEGVAVEDLHLVEADAAQGEHLLELGGEAVEQHFEEVRGRLPGGQRRDRLVAPHRRRDRGEVALARTPPGSRGTRRAGSAWSAAIRPRRCRAGSGATGSSRRRAGCADRLP